MTTEAFLHGTYTQCVAVKHQFRSLTLEQLTHISGQLINSIFGKIGHNFENVVQYAISQVIDKLDIDYPRVLLQLMIEYGLDRSDYETDGCGSVHLSNLIYISRNKLGSYRVAIANDTYIFTAKRNIIKYTTNDDTKYNVKHKAMYDLRCITQYRQLVFQNGILIGFQIEGREKACDDVDADDNNWRMFTYFRYVNPLEEHFNQLHTIYDDHVAIAVDSKCGLLYDVTRIQGKRMGYHIRKMFYNSKHTVYITYDNDGREKYIKMVNTIVNKIVYYVELNEGKIQYIIFRDNKYYNITSKCVFADGALDYIEYYQHGKITSTSYDTDDLELMMKKINNLLNAITVKHEISKYYEECPVVYKNIRIDDYPCYLLSA